MRENLPLQEFHQLGVHELVAIRNLQTDDTLAGERLLELAPELRSVASFHHENDIGPEHIFHREPDCGVALDARGINGEFVVSREYRFRRRTPPLIAPTDEEYVQGAIDNPE